MFFVKILNIFIYILMFLQHDVFVKKNKEDIFGKIKKKHTYLGLRSSDKSTIDECADYTPNNIVVFDEK